MQVPAPQTVEPVRQPRGSPSSLKTDEGLKNYYVAEFLKDLDVFSKEELDSDYPVKIFKDLARREAITLLDLIRLKKDLMKLVMQ